MSNQNVPEYIPRCTYLWHSRKNNDNSVRYIVTYYGLPDDISNKVHTVRVCEECLLKLKNELDKIVSLGLRYEIIRIEK